MYQWPQTPTSMHACTGFQPQLLCRDTRSGSGADSVSAIAAEQTASHARMHWLIAPAAVQGHTERQRRGLSLRNHGPADGQPAGLRALD